MFKRRQVVNKQILSQDLVRSELKSKVNCKKHEEKGAGEWRPQGMMVKGRAIKYQL